MDHTSAALIGAGLATMGMIGAGGYELIRRRDSLDDLLHNEIL